jgi:hypothetical protein
MTQQPRIPDLATSKRLLANLRKTRLEMAECNQEFAAINEMLAEHNCQQWAKRRSQKGTISDGSGSPQSFYRAGFLISESNTISVGKA